MKQEKVTQSHHRKKNAIIFLLVFLAVAFLIGRLVYLMVWGSSYYGQKATDIHEREREIKAARGCIYDRNGVLLASNETVCTISVIHSQVTDEQAVIRQLSKWLEMDEKKIAKKVKKVSSREKIASNVPIETGDAIRNLKLDGVKVDEDYKRVYPYGNLASKILGFTGGDNQGIVGLEVQYDKLLQGTSGKILTLTDAKGVELEGVGERRKEPVAGKDLHLTIDYNIQKYCMQEAEKLMEQKQAESVQILVMNPQNGEMYASVDVPEFNLNEPFTLADGYEQKAGASKQDALNNMWRNRCINDTYEPGSIFKIITASAALEEGVVTEEDPFYCPGYITVEDRRIRCAKVRGHGSESFAVGLQNSCKQRFGIKFENERCGIKKVPCDMSKARKGRTSAQTYVVCKLACTTTFCC